MVDIPSYHFRVPSPGVDTYAAREAVAVARQKAAADPKCEPQLADWLGWLQVALFADSDSSPAYRTKEILSLSEEAVALWRRAVVANPWFEVDLAEAVTVLSSMLRYSWHRRSEEALTTAEEAVARWRRLAASNPVHEYHLGQALNELADLLKSANRREEAARAHAEAAAVEERVNQRTVDDLSKELVACPVCDMGLPKDVRKSEHWETHVRTTRPGEGDASGNYIFECKCGPSAFSFSPESEAVLRLERHMRRHHGIDFEPIEFPLTRFYDFHRERNCSWRF